MRALFLCFAAVIGLAGVPRVAGAHPLGNFTANHLTRLRVAHGSIDLHYVLDLAEIPTVGVDRLLDPSGKPSARQYAGWGERHGAEITPQLELTVDGRPIALGAAHTTVITRPGAAGLHTIYFTADFRAALPPQAHQLMYIDRTEAGRLGWKDVVLAPATEPTRELRSYPGALVGSPRARLALAAAIDPAGGAHQMVDVPAAAPGQAGPSVARMNALSELLARDGSGPLFFLGALLLAASLGALHALEPGHGKTLLAVSLVGARATASQALILACALTAAHTTGVLVLGAIVLFAALDRA
jgi:hypothetical protein